MQRRERDNIEVVQLKAPSTLKDFLERYRARKYAEMCENVRMHFLKILRIFFEFRDCFPSNDSVFATLERDRYRDL